MAEYANIGEQLKESWYWKRGFWNGDRIAYRVGVLDHLAAVAESPFIILAGIVENIHTASENAKQIFRNKSDKSLEGHGVTLIEMCELKPITGGASCAPICT